MTARISLADAAVIAAVSLAAAVSYCLTAYPSVAWWDSGEIIACTHTLSVAHRPGFPLVIVAGRVFDFAIGGDPCRTVTLFSSFCAAIAVGLVALLAMRLAEGAQPSHRRLSALAAGVAVGGSGTVWLQAVRAEVYAPTLVVVVLMLHLALSCRKAADASSARRCVWALAFVSALGLGSHHLTVLSVLPGVAVIALSGAQARRSLRGLGVPTAIAFSIIGLSIYLYGPVRVRCSPPYVWGDVSTIGSALATAFPFGGAVSVGGSIAATPLSNVGGVVSGLVESIGMLAVASAMLGVVYAWLGSRALATALIVMLVGNLATGMKAGVIFVPDNPDLAGYLAPSAVTVGVFAGFGVAGVATWLKTSTRVSGTVIAGALTIGIAVSGAANFPVMDRSSDGYASAIGRAVLVSAPYRSILITDTVNLTFVLRALRSTGFRPDVTTVNRNIAEFDWARARLDDEARSALDSLVDGPPWSFPRRTVIELSERDVSASDWLARRGILFETAADSARRPLLPALFLTDASVFTLDGAERDNPDNVRFLVLWLARRAMLFQWRGERASSHAYEEWLERAAGE